MLSGNIADFTALAVALLVFVCVLVVCYFCLELREGRIRQSNFTAELTTGPLPSIERIWCSAPCPGVYGDQSGRNCCSASIVPP